MKPPLVIGCDDGEPVGWYSIGPRSDNTRLSRSRPTRPLGDLPVWSIVCAVIRGGHRKQRGYTTPSINGAVAYAAPRNAPTVESYPVDPGAERFAHAAVRRAGPPVVVPEARARRLEL